MNVLFTMAFAFRKASVAASYAPARAAIVPTDFASSSVSTSVIQLVLALASMSSQFGFSDWLWKFDGGLKVFMTARNCAYR